MKVEGPDLVFSDSVAMSLVTCRRKVHYQLIPDNCLGDIGAALTRDS